MNALAVVGSIASIIGFILSIILFIRTGNIQDNVKTALNQSAKVLAYNKHKQEIYCELNDCIKFFLDEHTLKEQKPYIQRMDVALSEFQTYHQRLRRISKLFEHPIMAKMPMSQLVILRLFIQ